MLQLKWFCSQGNKCLFFLSKKRKHNKNRMMRRLKCRTMHAINCGSVWESPKKGVTCDFGAYYIYTYRRLVGWLVRWLACGLFDLFIHRVRSTRFALATPQQLSMVKVIHIEWFVRSVYKHAQIGLRSRYCVDTAHDSHTLFYKSTSNYVSIEFIVCCCCRFFIANFLFIATLLANPSLYSST